MTGVLKRREEDSVGKVSHVKTEAEDARMKGMPGLMGAMRKRPGRPLPQSLQRENNLADTWFRPSAFTTVREWISVFKHQCSSVTCSVVSNCLWPHELQHARPPCPSPTSRIYPNSCPSSWWCHPAISSSVVPFPSCPPIPPSIRVFSNESTLHMRWPKYWSFSFSISPSNQHLGLIFRMDWLDLLAVQGTLKSLLQHCSKSSVLQCSAFFIVQL